MKENNKVEVKSFLGMEVRVVNNEYIVLKDMFKALGRLDDKEQIRTAERNKIDELLDILDKTTDSKSFTITLKGKKQSREYQEVECLKLETVPIILTQFKPTARVGELALQTWIKFMKFVDELLTSLEVYKFIVVDKERQKEHIVEITELGGSPTITNQQVNSIMAELIGVDGRVTKDELKNFQPQTTVDLLEVREFVLDKFVNAYEFTGSHKTAREMTTKLALKKYNLEEFKNIAV